MAEEIGRRASLAVENARLIAEAKRAQDEAERAAQRTARLQTLSAALAAALTPNDVATAAVSEGVAPSARTRGCSCCSIRRGTALDVVEARGYDRATIDRWRRFPLDRNVPLADAVRPGRARSSSRRPRGTRAASIRPLTQGGPVTYPASISVPLIAEGRSFGALGLSFRDPISVGPEDRELLLAVARQCAQAVRRATLFDAEAVARASAEAAGRRLTFLADASAALASLDYETTLQRVAQLAVPSFADYVIIDLLDETGAIQRVASAHADPAKAPLLRRRPVLPEREPDDHPSREPLERREPSLVAEVDDEWTERAGAKAGASGSRSGAASDVAHHGAAVGARAYVRYHDVRRLPGSGRRYGAARRLARRGGRAAGGGGRRQRAALSPERGRRGATRKRRVARRASSSPS